MSSTNTITQEEEKFARRDRIIADIVARTGINTAMIERLVHTFYGKIRSDPQLGPIFESRIHDWDSHLRQMCRFWASVTLMAGTYHGNPMEKHRELPVNDSHFERWLQLFDETAAEVCPPAAHAQFLDAAQRIAASLARSIGVPRAPGCPLS